MSDKVSCMKRILAKMKGIEANTIKGDDVCDILDQMVGAVGTITNNINTSYPSSFSLIASPDQNVDSSGMNVLVKKSANVYKLTFYGTVTISADIAGGSFAPFVLKTNPDNLLVTTGGSTSSYLLTSESAPIIGTFYLGGYVADIGGNTCAVYLPDSSLKAGTYHLYTEAVFIM